MKRRPAAPERTHDARGRMHEPGGAGVNTPPEGGLAGRGRRVARGRGIRLVAVLTLGGLAATGGLAAAILAAGDSTVETTVVTDPDRVITIAGDTHTISYTVPTVTVTETTTVPTVTVTVPAPTTTSAPPRFYSATSPFNTPIDPSAAVDPNSSAYVSALTAIASNGSVITVKRYSVPVYRADSATPRYKLALTAPWRLADHLLDVPIPDGAVPAAGTDKHMAIVDSSTGCEYDLYDAVNVNGLWQAAWANAMPYASGDGWYEGGSSARGSGAALLGGLMMADELHGTIDHALILSSPVVRAGGPVPPATESDGRSTRSDALPEGARLQLDPGFDESRLPYEWQRRIARALKIYGAFVGDVSASTVDLYAQDPVSLGSNPYADLWGDQTYVALPTTLISSLRVLELPAQYDPQPHRAPNGCNHYQLP
jgi:hypothetical protein